MGLIAAGDLVVFRGLGGMWGVPTLGGRATLYDVPTGYIYVPAYDGESVFVTDDAGKIYRLDPVTGEHEQYLLGPALGVFAADCEFLFWRHADTLALLRTDRATNAAVQVTDGAFDDMALDADTLYVAGGGQLLAFDKHTFETVEVTHPGGDIVDVAVDETHVYWLDGAELWTSPKPSPP